MRRGLTRVRVLRVVTKRRARKTDREDLLSAERVYVSGLRGVLLGLRNRGGEKQAAVGRRCGLSKSWVRGLEHGRLAGVTLQTLLRISIGYSMPVSELLQKVEAEIVVQHQRRERQRAKDAASAPAVAPESAPETESLGNELNRRFEESKVAAAGAIEKAYLEVTTVEPPCANGHVWENDFGDDWTPDVGTPCVCGERRWGGSTSDRVLEGATVIGTIVYDRAAETSRFERRSLEPGPEDEF